MTYLEYFIKYWLPVYRRQVFKAKFFNDEEALKSIYKNISLNWNLQDYKDYIIELLGIKYIGGKL